MFRVQVSNLQRENREQINLIKKTNQEHKMEVENVKKKNQVREKWREWRGGVGVEEEGALIRTFDVYTVVYMCSVYSYIL